MDSRRADLREAEFAARYEVKSVTLHIRGGNRLQLSLDGRELRICIIFRPAQGGGSTQGSVSLAGAQGTISNAPSVHYTRERA